MGVSIQKIKMTGIVLKKRNSIIDDITVIRTKINRYKDFFHVLIFIFIEGFQ